MLRIVLKHCLIDLKDGKSQRGSIVRLSPENQKSRYLIHLFHHYDISYDIIKSCFSCRAQFALSTSASKKCFDPVVVEEYLDQVHPPIFGPSDIPRI